MRVFSQGRPRTKWRGVCASGESADSRRTWPTRNGGATIRGVEGSMRRWVVSNRRGAMRHAVQISCQVVRERDFRLVADTIVDLSTTGMLVTPADPVLTGERVIASFRLPGSTFW